MTTLPGVHFEEESYDASFDRAVGELQWRVEQARTADIVFGVEAHVGSLAPDPTSARRLVQQVAGLTLTLDTVYRTLAKLEGMGLAIQVSIVASRMRFEANTDHHHHFVCRTCGTVLDVYSKKLDRLQRDVEVPGGHKADWIQVELRGTCQKCLARGRRTRRKSR